MSTTRHIQAADEADEVFAELREEAERRLASGHSVAVTLADEGEEFTPQQAADRLGFSRQHVQRLIDVGRIKAHRLPNSRHQRISLRALAEFEQRRDDARREADEHARRLNELGAPLE